tara:strand:+ start:838 stop:1191 length:354 start_codon:yes stop_codon:yes gene_type:complete
MTSSYELPLFGGVVQAQRLIVPTQVVKALESYRHACRMAWKLRSVKNLTRRTLAEASGLYAPHVSDYFSVKPNKRSLPAEHIAAVERVLGNTVISQYQAGKSNLTVLEEMQVARRAA